MWYSLTASAPAYLLDMSQSNYTGGFIVATGTPGNLTLVTCGPTSVGFEATAGTTYFLMALSDNPDVVGGQLTISVTETTPRPKISMTINEVGRVNTRTGVATIGGTFTCEGEAEFTFMQGRLSQRQGDVFVVGTFLQEGFACDGFNEWKAEITPESGKFQRGLAATIALTAACNRLGCNAWEELDTIRLRGGH